MDVISTPDLQRMDDHELAALLNEVLKAFAQATQNRRAGDAVLQDIRRARAEPQLRLRKL